MTNLAWIFFSLFCWQSFFAAAKDSQNKVRLKEIVQIKGFRSNSLIGYGMVFGLSGTGDTAASVTSKKTMSKMLNQLGVQANADQIVAGNFASVIVTAELPPFARSGGKIDVRISANGDATSLAGGTLLMTKLRGGDKKVYAVAQGPVVVGDASGQDVSVLTVATVPNGAYVEQEFLPELFVGGKISLSLKTADFTTNDRVVKEINRYFKGLYARSTDPGGIELMVPPLFRSDLVSFLAKVESLKVQKDKRAKVVVNERTGTIVMGSQVLVSPITIAHGSLSIEIKANEGEDSRKKRILGISGTTIGDLVDSLNQLEVKPSDLIGILQALHRAEALDAELEFM